MKHIVALAISMALVVGCTSQATAAPAASPTSLPPTATITAEPSPTPSVEASATPEGEKQTPRLFGPEHFYGGGPALPHGEEGRWDGKYVFASAVVEHEGTFILFYKGFASSSDGMGGVGIATSQDGFTWEKRPDPVLTDPGASYATAGFVPYSVLVEEDGGWVMYFHAWNGGRSAPALGGPDSVIGRATAPAAEGPWTLDAEPMLRGTGWASGGVALPSVIRTADGYLMIFSGDAGSPEDSAIGAATSADGIAWTMQPEPVLSPAEDNTAWDGRIVGMGNVVSTPQGYVMVYAGIGRNTRTNDYGLAFSQDGLTWERYDDNPVLRTADLPGGRSLHTQRLFYVDGTYFLFFEAVGQRDSELWLSVFEGELVTLLSISLADSGHRILWLNVTAAGTMIHLNLTSG